MKIIKTVFLISLFNFFIVGSVVLAMSNKKLDNSVVVGVVPTTVSEVAKVTTTPLPTQRKTQVVKAKTTDPFAVIFSQKELPQQKVISVPSQNTGQVNNQAPAAPTADSRCVIVIDGGRYDVSAFRNQHSGGNVFSCGTDMSAIFHGEHPNSFLQKMARYKI